MRERLAEHHVDGRDVADIGERRRDRRVGSGKVLEQTPAYVANVDRSAGLQHRLGDGVADAARTGRNDHPSARQVGCCLPTHVR